MLGRGREAVHTQVGIIPAELQSIFPLKAPFIRAMPIGLTELDDRSNQAIATANRLVRAEASWAVRGDPPLLGGGVS